LPAGQVENFIAAASLQVFLPEFGLSEFCIELVGAIAGGCIGGLGRLVVAQHFKGQLAATAFTGLLFGHLHHLCCHALAAMAINDINIVDVEDGSAGESGKALKAVTQTDWLVSVVGQDDDAVIALCQGGWQIVPGKLWQGFASTHRMTCILIQQVDDSLALCRISCISDTEFDHDIVGGLNFQRALGYSVRGIKNRETVMTLFKKFDPRLSVYDHFVVHCTATKASQKDVDAAWVDKAHKQRGWSGCGYHAVITRSGKLQMHDKGFPTRAVGSKGAHVGGCGAGWNRRSFGVTLAGGLDRAGQPQDNFTKPQYRSLVGLINAFLEAHENPQAVTILGHRDLIRLTNAAPKACPCFDVARFLIDYDINTDEDANTDADDSPLLIPALYTVKSGDSLWKIAHHYGVPLARLKAFNQLQSDVIHKGQQLRLQ